jgi:hypothetical protein
MRSGVRDNRLHFSEVACQRYGEELMSENSMDSVTVAQRQMLYSEVEVLRV